jgi:hypothetical protein
MRMMPARYLERKPLLVKKAVAKVKHLSAPLKGLSLSSKLQEGDPLTAPILDNFIIEENQIRARAGTKLIYTDAGAQPIWCLIPYYGGLNRLAAATNGEIRLFNGSLVKGGFTSNDWHWTAFSNLSANEYTVMVNGTDGVWSWDGGTSSTAPAPVTVTSLSNANPAVCTVAAGSIAQFTNGMVVNVAGATGAMAPANGPHVILSVNVPVNTFQLVGVDTSAAPAPQTTGVTAAPAGTGIVKEVVTAPSYSPYIVPDHFDIVISHMNRLWFADKDNLAIYYLPIQQKSGVVTELPLNAVFRRGGTIKALYTWTLDGGAGLDDLLAIFSSNGELVLYRGVDPDTDMTLHGIFRFDSPMSKHSVVNYGGELYVLISTGLVPMSTLMKAESEQLGQEDRNVFSEFFSKSLAYRTLPGWSVMLNPSSGRMICNLPLGSANNYKQLIRFMPNPVWASWSGLRARCWGWMDNRVYFGSDEGKVYETHPDYLSDVDKTGAPVPIKVDVQASWSSYGTSAFKQFKMVLPYIISDGNPKPYLDMRVDYDATAPTNQPDVTSAGALGASWDTASWDTASWGGTPVMWINWQGVSGLGRVGAPRMTAYIVNCSFALSGWDVLYETGSVFG